MLLGLKKKDKMLKKTINLPSFSIFLKEFCRNFINERKRGYEWITSQLHGEPISEKPRGYSSKPFLIEGDRSSQQTQYVLDKPKLFWFENIIRNTCKWTHIYIYQTYFMVFLGDRIRRYNSGMLRNGNVRNGLRMRPWQYVFMHKCW